MPFKVNSLDPLAVATLLASLPQNARSADLEERVAAFRALSDLAFKIGARLAVVMPTLLEGLADPDDRIGDSAVHALSNCHPASLAPLVACLSRAEPRVRERAAHALGNMGDKARTGASGPLRERLADASEPVRRRAAWALGLLHDGDPRTAAALDTLIRHGTPSDRAGALHAFGNIAAAASNFPPLRARQDAILAGLDDDDCEVRRGAFHAFGALDWPLQQRAERCLAMLARETHAPLKESLRHDLMRLAPRADLRAHVDTLLAMLRADAADRRDAVCAARLLADMRPPPPEAAVVPALEAALRSPELRLPAGRALWRITGHVVAYLAVLEDALGQPGEDLCDLVAELGPLGAPLVPRLIAALEDDHWHDLQWAAADALGAVASPVPQALLALANALTHPSAIVRTAAARALGKMTDGMPRLIDILESGDPRAPRTAAAWAVAQMGAGGRAARPALKALRDTTDAPLRSAVRAALKASSRWFRW